MENGTAAQTDVKNIELYDVTHGVSLGTVAAYNAEGKVTWGNLNIVVGKGETQRFKILVDIVSGAGLTTNIDLVDGSDVLVSVKGNTYGFYITPTNSWTNGLGTDQTIGSGTLNISKSSKTPATGNIAVGDDIVLGAWDFDARGEEMRISQFIVTITAADNSSNSLTFTSADVTNVKLYDANGNIVAGPNDPSSSDVTFTDTFVVPVGAHTYYLKAKVGTDAGSLDTVLVDAKTPGTSVTAKGMTTNTAPTLTPSGDVACNTMTVAAGSLTVSTLNYPAARSVPKGITDMLFATFSLDATSSGENVQVTAITVTDTKAGDAVTGDIDNAELWADLTSANSTGRGDVYETLVTSTKQFTTGTATLAFPLTQTITVPKGSFVRLAIIADLAAGATSDGGDTHTFTIADADASVTSTGATTGSSIVETYSVSGAQAMLVSGGGTLAVTKDSSSPVADLLVAGQSGATLAVFRLAETGKVEDLDLDSIKVYVSGYDSVNTLYFYSSARSDGGSTSSPIATGVVTGESVSVQITDGRVTIPQDGNVKITVKGDLLAVDGTVVTNDTGMKVSILHAADVKTTGRSVGGAVNSTEVDVLGNTHYLVKSKPTFALNSSSPSGNLVTAATTEVARFNITANSAEDITFSTAKSNTLTVSVSCKIKDSDAGNETIYLVDQDGNTLDTLTSDVCASSYAFDFTNNSLTIPAGQTKWVKVVADTTELGDAGDLIQLYLDDVAGNIAWSINASTAIGHGDIIFRGDIMANVLTTPSGSSD